MGPEFLKVYKITITHSSYKIVSLGAFVTISRKGCQRIRKTATVSRRI